MAFLRSGSGTLRVWHGRSSSPISAHRPMPPPSVARGTCNLRSLPDLASIGDHTADPPRSCAWAPCAPRYIAQRQRNSYPFLPLAHDLVAQLEGWLPMVAAVVGWLISHGFDSGWPPETQLLACVRRGAGEIGRGGGTNLLSFPLDPAPPASPKGTAVRFRRQAEL